MERYQISVAKVSALIFLTAALGVALPQRGKLPKLSRGEVISKQIQDDVAQAVAINASAGSLKEWETSGYTPADIFKAVDALKSSHAWNVLCGTLLKLHPSDLALFEEQIKAKEYSLAMACEPRLADRIATYWSDNAKALARVSRDSEKLKTAENPVDPVLKTVATGEELKAGEIMLSFDGGPDIDRTQKVLRALKAAGARAMFFEAGKRTRLYPQLAREVLADNHVVGSMGFNAAALADLDLKSAETDILDGRDSVAAALGKPIAFFRFPYGESSEHLDRFVEQQHLVKVPATIDSEDWKIRDSSKLLARIFQKLDSTKSGILEMHDGNEQTVLILPLLLEDLKKRNVTTVVYVPRKLSSAYAKR